MVGKDFCVIIVAITLQVKVMIDLYYYVVWRF